MKEIDLSNVKEFNNEFARPVPGGYIAKICNVTDVPEKEYLLVQWDYAEGELEGYHSNREERWGSWPVSGNLYRSYRDSALGMFKHFISCVEKSNPGYVWDNNEQNLIGKLVGVVIGEDWYEYNGEERCGLKVRNICTMAEIKNGNYITPAPQGKKQQTQRLTTDADGFMQMPDDAKELPF